MLFLIALVICVWAQIGYAGRTTLALVNQDLLDAAKKGDLEAVKTLLAKGAQVNARDTNAPTLGATPLIFASAYGHLPVVQLLLEKKANVNAETEKSQLTSVSLASAQGHLSIVEMLIANGALVKDTDSQESFANGIPILFAACGREFAVKDQAAVLRVLFDKSPKISNNINLRTLVFHLATFCGHGDLWDVFKPEVAIKKDIDSTIFINNLTFFVLVAKLKVLIVDSLYNFGLKDIWVAAQKGDIPVIEKLLAEGTDVNSVSKSTWTALMDATQKLQIDTVKLLLSRGADVDIKTKDGRTALDLAKKLDESPAKKDITKLLEEAKKNKK